MTERESLEQFGQSFRSVMAAVRRLKGRETHKPGELSFAQYSLLFRLADEGPLPAGELAFMADLSPATATQMLDSLAKAGLVARVRSETDKRVVIGSLTELGRELIAERRALLEARWEAALEGFTDEDLRTAAAVLDRARAVFDDLAERPLVAPLAEVAR